MTRYKGGLSAERLKSLVANTDVNDLTDIILEVIFLDSPGGVPSDGVLIPTMMKMGVSHDVCTLVMILKNKRAWLKINQSWLLDDAVFMRPEQRFNMIGRLRNCFGHVPRLSRIIIDLPYFDEFKQPWRKTLEAARDKGKPEYLEILVHQEQEAAKAQRQWQNQQNTTPTSEFHRMVINYRNTIFHFSERSTDKILRNFVDEEVDLEINTDFPYLFAKLRAAVIFYMAHSDENVNSFRALFFEAKERKNMTDWKV